MNPTADGVAPLLIELARAIRAYQFFEPGHATRAHAMAKAAALWMDQLPKLGELELEVNESGFVLGGVEAVPSASLRELAAAFTAHGILALQIHPDLTVDELAETVEAISRDPAALPDGGLAGALRSAGVRHLALWVLPTVSAQPKRTHDTHVEVQAPQATVPELPAVELPGVELPDLETHAEAPAAASTKGQPQQALLLDLEGCEEVGAYRVAANQADSRLDKLLAAHEFEEAYGIGLVFARHADDSSRPALMRNEARGRLRALFRNATLLTMVVENALEGAPKRGPSAVQVLCWLAPQSVIRLLDEHSRGDTNRRTQATSVLITMGEQSLPTLVDELGDESPARARRAARILGDMQNPAAVEFLADHLRHPDPATQREVALALARVGTTRAIQVLEESLGGPADLAVVAAGGLGSCRSKSATRALARAVDERSGHSEAVRREAMRSLGRIRDPEAIPALKEILDRGSLLARKKNRPLRIAAAQAIAQIGGEQAYLALEPHSAGGDSALQKTCQELLGQLEQDRAS